MADRIVSNVSDLHAGSLFTGPGNLPGPTGFSRTHWQPGWPANKERQSGPWRHVICAAVGQ